MALRLKLKPQFEVTTVTIPDAGEQAAFEELEASYPEAEPPMTEEGCPHDLSEDDAGKCEICVPTEKVLPGRCTAIPCIAPLQLPYPHIKYITLAKDLDTELEYVNVEHHHLGAMYKIFKALRGTPDGYVLIAFWADNLQEWLQCKVPWNYRLTTAPEYLKAAARPSQASPELRKKRAAHLAQYRKVRAELPPEPAHPTNCIVGQIGPNKVLVNAGDGTVLGTYPVAGFVAKTEAQKLGRILVGQKDATVYAMTVLRRAWADAKAVGK